MNADEVKMVKGAFGFDGRPVVGDVNGLADLAELDHELRRVGRNDEHVRVGLDEDARLALVGFAQIVAGVDGLVDELFEVGGGGDAACSWSRRRRSRAGRRIQWG